MFEFKRRTKFTDNSKFETYELYRTGCYLADGKISENSCCTHLSVNRMYGCDIVDFHRHLRGGELLPHTFYSFFSSTGESSGEMDQSTGGCHQFSIGRYAPWEDWRITGDGPFLPILPTNPQGLAQEAAAKIYGNGYDALTFLVEITDVKDLFVNFLTGLLRKKWPTGISDMSSRWLSTRYGWRTLIYDLQDLNELLSNFKSEKKRMSEKAYSVFKTSSSDIVESQLGVANVNFHIDDSFEIKVRGSVVADVEVPALQFNLLQTGWEKVPFGFVLDWIVQIGKALAAYSFLALRPDYYASYGWKIQLRRTFSSSIESTVTDWTSSSWQNGSVNASLTRRYPCAIPLMPHIRVNLNSFKIIDLIALIIQRK